ncbi:MAG: glutamate--tRNA ligase [Alphaproteobacteria bacterium]|nr:glutamate--tRNA ligase [Alphaproteobacteria bacterium]
MTVTVRFAPSPTGFLHVGNARVALLNWLYARAQGGRFVLRLDDTDAERSRPEYARAIGEDLSWLGLSWSGQVRQSERLDRHRAAEARLREAGRLYPCYETPEELELRRKLQLSRGRPPVYDRAALALDGVARARLESGGRRPHWRFLLDDRDAQWDDLVRGPCHYSARHLSDPVLVRADGTYLYTLPSVVDDIDLGITHVIRGDDHVTNTAVQIQVFEALGAPPCAFAHVALLTDATGQGLSKRLGSMSLRDLRDEGVEPETLVNFLATLGTSEAMGAVRSLDGLAAGFDFARIGRAQPRFDDAELRHANARYLHDMPFAAARPRLAALGLSDANEAFWLAVRPNLARLSEAVSWWAVCGDAIRPVIEDPAFAAAAAALLPPEPWDGTTWGVWTSAVRQATGRKGKDLFHPLRLALTGLDHGPELKGLLPLIGRERVLERLSGATKNGSSTSQVDSEGKNLLSLLKNP